MDSIRRLCKSSTKLCTYALMTLDIMVFENSPAEKRSWRGSLFVVFIENHIFIR